MGQETILLDANASAGAFPGIWYPSTMEGNSTPEIIDMYEGIPGTLGITRVVQPFGSTYGFEDATSSGQYDTRAAAYFGQSEVLTAITRGTMVLTIHGPPPYLASATPMYSTFVPADNAAAGTWQARMQSLVGIAQTALGANYKNPRVGGTGAVQIGLPGIIWECGNEWGGGTAGELANAKTTYQRLRAGILAADPNAVVCLPPPLTYDRAEASGKTTLREFVEFAGNVGSGGAPAVIGWHCFQGFAGHDYLIEEDTDLAKLEADTALTAAGLPVSTPRIITEYQCNLTGTEGTEAHNGYQSAAYEISSRWEQWRNGVAGICMASLIKQGDTPADATPFTDTGLFGGWGQVTRGTVKIPTANFSAMKLFSLWDGGLPIATPAQSFRSASRLRYFAARKNNDVIVALARWQPRGLAVPVQIQASNPGRSLVEARVYRFDATRNNVQKVFTDTVGTDIQKGTAAQSAGLNPTYEVVSYPVNLSLVDRDSAVVHLVYS